MLSAYNNQVTLTIMIVYTMLIISYRLLVVLVFVLFHSEDLFMVEILVRKRNGLLL